MKQEILKLARKVSGIGRHGKSLDQLIAEASDLFSCYRVSHRPVCFMLEYRCTTSKPWLLIICRSSLAWERNHYCTRFPGDTPKDAVKMFLDYVDQKHISVPELMNEALSLNAEYEDGPF